jgi:hypothetical protein
MPRKQMPAGPGRPKGLPNKATQQAREAIALFVDNNAYRLQEWLDDIARGVSSGKPEPQKAFELFQSVIEYHVPKLQRSQIEGGDPDKPIKHDVNVNFVAAKPSEDANG